MQKNRNKKKTEPIMKDEEVQSNPDPHIDQDFPGFPHPPSTEKLIQPGTPQEKADAGILPPKSERKINKRKNGKKT